MSERRIRGWVSFSNTDEDRDAPAEEDQLYWCTRALAEFEDRPGFPQIQLQMLRDRVSGLQRERDGQPPP